MNDGYFVMGMESKYDHDVMTMSTQNRVLGPRAQMWKVASCSGRDDILVIAKWDRCTEWRQDPNVKSTYKSDGKGKKKFYTKKRLAALVNKRIKLAMDKSSEEMKTQDDTKAYIMSLIQETLDKKGSAPSQASAATAKETSVPTYHSIVKRAKNHQS
jgi:hypothetical protein